MGYYYGSNISTILILLGFFISLIATIGVNVSYRRYKKVKSSKNLTGFDVARQILDENGLNDVLILETKGELSDHYDPQKKVVKLSSDIYHDKSIASISVAAHECGHAIQDKENYPFLRFRGAIFPIVNLSSKLGYFAIMIGIIFSMTDLLWIGIGFEIVILLFQLVTLPVEFNASKRALTIIEKNGIVSKNEKNDARKMLTAAAMTYVAGVLTSLLEILRLILIARDRD